MRRDSTAAAWRYANPAFFAHCRGDVLMLSLAAPSPQLLAAAALRLAPPLRACPRGCAEESTCQPECLVAECNWDGGQCRRRFEEAGADAAAACDRAACAVWEERWSLQCVAGCVTAQCDWSEANARCRALLDPLAACPLFDAAAYASLRRQTDVAFVSAAATDDDDDDDDDDCGYSKYFYGYHYHPWYYDDDGTYYPYYYHSHYSYYDYYGSLYYYCWSDTRKWGALGGYGRCVVNSTCTAGSGSCRTIDDNGRAMRQEYRDGTHLLDEGPSIGLCADKPRLPVSGFSYSTAEMESLAQLSIDEMFSKVCVVVSLVFAQCHGAILMLCLAAPSLQFPGCGSSPLEVRGNHAGRNGGGLYQSPCAVASAQRGSCFIGEMVVGAEVAARIVFEANSATGGGGGVFTSCPDLGPCKAMLESELGVPRPRGQAAGRVLALRANRAGGYGNDVGSAPARMQGVLRQTRCVPGRDGLDLAVQLLDALGQAVVSPAAKLPYLVEVRVCAAANDCASRLGNELQAAILLQYSSSLLYTIDMGANLLYCRVGYGSVAVHISLAGSEFEDVEALSQTHEVACESCPADYALTVTNRANGALWSCQECLIAEYVLDPNNPDHACTTCPAAALCSASGVCMLKDPHGTASGCAGADGLRGAWEPDHLSGQYRLQQCPPGYRLVNSSAQGGFSHDSQGCFACPAGYYLDDLSATAIQMFDKPSEFCKRCPLHAKCPHGSSLETLVVPPNFWRLSNATSRLYPCYEDSAGLSSCRGSNTPVSRRSEGFDDSIYCIEGHRGPRCAVCVSPSQYFDVISARCEDCTSSDRLVLVGSVIGGIAAFSALGCLVLWNVKPADWIARRFARRLALNSARIGAGAKFKQIVGFGQIFNTLSAVYGVRFHSNFQSFFSVLKVFNFDVVDVLLPGKCVGSISRRITATAIAPFVLTLMVMFVIAAKDSLKRTATRAISSRKFAILGQCMYAAIFIFFLALPSVRPSC